MAPKTYAQLERFFSLLGVTGSEDTIRSELEENIPHSARLAFLVAAWRQAVDPTDSAQWVSNIAQTPPDDGPLGGLAPALRRMLAKGVDPQDIAEVVRCRQYETLFAICTLLDGDIVDDGLRKALDEFGVGWTLMETDGDFVSTDRTLSALHEDALSLDPSGREMRPRGRDPR